MKPLFEKITVPEGSSWALLHRLLPKGIPFEWHYHPEFELTMTLNSQGQRFIGDHVGDYEDGDLVLLGPNLPHTWESRERLDPAAPHEVIVMWFAPGWVSALGRSLPELRQVQRLLRSARRGLFFDQETSADVRPLATSLPALDTIDRLPVLLSILIRIARGAVPEPLASDVWSATMRVDGSDQPDQDRIERVLNYIHAHYAEVLSLEQLAQIAHLSTSALSRVFKRTTGVSVTDYLTRLRIGRACAMLIDDRYAIAYIAGEVGYKNLSNFNRRFLAVKGMQPSAFRKQYREKLRRGT